MTLWKEVIRIPEKREDNRYVVELSGVHDRSKAKEIVETYVVTDSVRDSFAQALGGISEAMEKGSRRGYFLDGTFGSGKSHFMAVLYLILNGYEEALSINRLAKPVMEFQGRHEGKKFLLIPFHFVGAKSIEQMVFKTYIEHVRKLYPNAKRPALLETERVFAIAESLRKDVGDESFIEKLNQVDGTDGDDGDGDEADLWGDTVSNIGWSIERYSSARDAEPGSAERSALLRTLANIETVAHAFDFAAGTSQGVGHWNQEQFTELDAGLHEMSLHAKELGYDGLVLFLDELILWLMSQTEAADFVQREVSKLVKLVESRSNTPDEIPIISFIARQKQFSEFLGDIEVGSQRAVIGDEMDHFEKRFHLIDLPKSDIAEIAQERLLKPKSPEAEQAISESFGKTVEQLERTSADKVDTLVSRDYTREYFRKVYPFTPALSTVLIALSEMLQRNRSALLVMTGLLVERRDKLELGDLISVGRLWDILQDAEPMSMDVKERFKQARQLWSQTFDPYLRKRDNLPLKGSVDEAGGNTFRYEQDAIVIKTLLLQTLVPRVEPLLQLTVRQLVTLNSSDIRSQFAGSAVSDVLGRLQSIASEIPALRVSEGSNPIVRIVLSKVDVNRLIGEHSHIDNTGSRTREFRRLFLKAAGYEDLSTARNAIDFEWGGARRKAEIHFLNVRKATEADFLSRETIRLVVDYPFDEEDTRKPSDDVANLDEIRESPAFKQRQDEAFSVVWLPHHFSEPMRRSLGKLATVRHMLQNVNTSLRSVSEDLRGEAEQMLRATMATLEKHIDSAILDAYHLSGGEGLDTLGERLDDSRHYFTNTFLADARMEKPSSATVEKVVEELFKQGFRKRFPGAPQAPSLPDKPLTSKALTDFADAMVDAFESQKASYSLSSLDKRTREAVVRYGPPLKLIEKGDTDSNNVKVSDHWKRTIAKERSVNPPSRFDVGWFRQVLDPSELRTGFPEDLQDVIILAWAAGAGYGFKDLAEQVNGQPGKLENHYELSEASLPSEESWAIFGESQDSLLGELKKFRRSPRGVTDAARAFREKFRQHQQPLGDLLQLLDAEAKNLRIEDERWQASDRRRNIVAAHKFAGAAASRHASDAELIEQAAGIIKRYEDLAFGRVTHQASIAADHVGFLRSATLLDLRDLAKIDTDEAAIRKAHDTLCFQEGVAQLRSLQELIVPARERLQEIRHAEAMKAAARDAKQADVEAEAAIDAQTVEPEAAVVPEQRGDAAVEPSAASGSVVRSLGLRQSTLREVVSELEKLTEDESDEYIVEIRKK